MPHIAFQSGPRQGETLELQDGLCVGREAGCELTLDDSKVSRRHARFTSRDGRWAIQDLGSTHGTFVNRERVAEAHLAGGDHIQLGHTLFLFQDTDCVSQVLREIPTEAPGGEARGADARLRIFHDLAGAIADLSDTDALLLRLLASVVDVVGAERGAVGLCEPGGLRLLVHARPGVPAGVVLANEVRAAVLSRRSAIVMQEPGRSDTLDRQRVRSAMAAPLLAAGQVLGVLYADDRGSPGRFGDADIELLSTLGRLCAAALAAAVRFQGADAVAEAARNDGRLGQLEGESRALDQLRATLRSVAGADAHVVIRGETGTGKELVARALHALSPRAEQPFVAVSCAALHEETVESELFGHEKGAFTGAERARRGCFVLAHRGTLFLDEIAEMSAATQAKVLRAIQEREVQPLGAERPIRVDVRIVAASHKDLWREVQEGRFREDLYYRLHVVDIAVPPLREREGDVALLASRFMKRAAQRLGKSIVGFSAEALEALSAHPWPGNVRELLNEVERAAIVAAGPLVEVWDVSARIRGASMSLRPPQPAAPSPDAPRVDASLAERFAALEPTEKALVQQALAMARGNLAEAARILGVTRIMVKRRMDRFGLTADKDE